MPEGTSFGTELLNQINTRLGNKRFISAVSEDSAASRGLQVADLLASAVFHYRQKVEELGLEGYLRENTPKSRLSRSMASILGLGSFDDCRTTEPTVRIQTSFEKSLRELHRVDTLVLRDLPESQTPSNRGSDRVPDSPSGDWLNQQPTPS